MSRARFVPVLGHTVDDQLRPAWPGAGRLVDARSTPRPWVAWRLLGGNHRELARSATVFAEVDECVRAVSLLQDALRRGAAEPSIEAVERWWGWRVGDGALDLAVASRLYVRQRECEHNCRIFLATASDAAVAVTTPFPDRRRQSM